MHTCICRAIALSAWMIAAGCGAEDSMLPNSIGSDGAIGDVALLVLHEKTLCEIVVGASRLADVEAILGNADRRETSDSTSLLYQYPTGLTLSLLFRQDVLVDATVYNSRYPDCWEAAERRRDEALIPLTERDALLDAGH